MTSGARVVLTGEGLQPKATKLVAVVRMIEIAPEVLPMASTSAAIPRDGTLSAKRPLASINSRVYVACR